MADENYRDLAYERNLKRKLSEGLPNSVFVGKNFPSNKYKTSRALRLTYEAFSSADIPSITEGLFSLGINPNDTRICVNRKRE